MAIIRWDPFRDLLDIHDEVNRLFRRSFFGEGGRLLSRDRGATAWAPAIDVFETKDHVVVTAELPGLSADEVSISLDDNVLSIKGERRFSDEVKEENYHRIERAYGYFERNIPLPRLVKEGEANATFADGVLRVELPKAEEVKPKQIPIKVEEPKKIEKKK